MERKLVYFLSGIVLASLSVSCSSRQAEPQPAQVDAAKDYTVVNNDTIWTMADQMPVFNGGDSALLGYILRNTKYPEQARKAGVEGKCYVRFCVTPQGTVAQTSIIKGVTPELDAEALRVVSTLPKFEYSATKNGRPVAVWYIVPIQFKLD